MSENTTDSQLLLQQIQILLVRQWSNVKVQSGHKYKYRFKSSVVIETSYEPSKNILLKGLFRSLLTPRLILLIVSSRSPRLTLLWRVSDASGGIGGGGGMRRPLFRGDLLRSFTVFGGKDSFAGDGSLRGVDTLVSWPEESIPSFNIDVGPADIRSILDWVS